MAKSKQSKLEAARAGLEIMLERHKRGDASAEALQYARNAVAGLERLDAEKEALRKLEVPAVFGGKPIPDTDEARLSRRQLEISKGKDVPSW